MAQKVKPCGNDVRILCQRDKFTYYGMGNDDPRRWQVAGEIASGLPRKDTGTKMSSADWQTYVQGSVGAKADSKDSWLGKAWAAATSSSAYAETSIGGKASIAGKSSDSSGYDRMQVGIKSTVDGAYSDYGKAKDSGFKGTPEQLAASRVKEFIGAVDNDAMARQYFGLGDVENAAGNVAKGTYDAAGNAAHEMRPAMAMTPGERDKNAKALGESMKGRMGYNSGARPVTPTEPHKPAYHPMNK